ncbi:Hpt domain-containing protein [Azospirillum soli]|uniref:Hpt domain-containing protein n=1 Tax=Azospirillum soli TaxID=1304799 RepID=UPI001AE3E12B|nr:Hpt domain-containing protein [Azospirillum soli]MBP2315596.1 HPt (histidine-containing phosphotransfer) domain-containing protein [Azospirillum soli]
MATPRRYAPEWTEAAHRIAVDELVEVVGRDGAAHLIGVFLRELPKRAEAFRQGGERDAIFRQAHEMQAMAGSFGLDALAEAAGELERACRRRRSAVIPALSGRVLDRIGQATVVLEQSMKMLGEA